MPGRSAGPRSSECSRPAWGCGLRGVTRRLTATIPRPVPASVPFSPEGATNGAGKGSGLACQFTQPLKLPAPETHHNALATDAGAHRLLRYDAEGRAVDEGL